MDGPSENHTWQQCIAIIINNVINSSAGRHPLQQIKHLPASWQSHLTVHHLLTHASQAYVNDERTGGGLKVLERAGLSAWLLFLCNVSVWYAAAGLSVTQESWRLRGRETAALIRDRGRCSEDVCHCVSTSLSSSASLTHFSNCTFTTLYRLRGENAWIMMKWRM